MAEIKLRGIHKNFGATEVIRGVDIDIEDGSFVVFVGPSGCGKSTLLRLIAGLEDISAGELLIDGRVVNALEPKDRGVAMVFQSYAIFPHMTVRENIAFGLTIRRENRNRIDHKVNEAAKMLQLESLLERRPSQLSGGQRQRVAIGRAIVRDPTVFLFDEPLSNLDAALRMSTRQEIAALHAQLRATMIYVTHDQVEAMTLADRIVVLRDGKVMQAGTPMELYHRPANRFVAGFLGAPAMNFFPVQINSVSASGIEVSGALQQRVSLPHRPGFSAGQTATLGVRPQQLRIVPVEQSLLAGEVVVTERLGSETVFDVLLNNQEKLIASIPEDAQLHPGELIGFDFDPHHAHLFSDNS